MIRQCTIDDIVLCLDARSIENTGIDPASLNENDFIVCAQKEAIMLAHFINNGSAAEVHIICPKFCARMSRSMCVEVVEYMKFLGFYYITTRVLNKYPKAHNLVMKLGFICVFSTQHESFYWRSICR